MNMAAKGLKLVGAQLCRVAGSAGYPTIRRACHAAHRQPYRAYAQSESDRQSEPDSVQLSA